MLDTYLPSVMETPPNPISYENRAFWAAVLRQAIDDFRGCPDAHDKDSCHHQRLRREDADRWFRSDATYLNSFLSVCGILRLDPGQIRRRLFMEQT
jgi:hypothetical protein